MQARPDCQKTHMPYRYNISRAYVTGRKEDLQGKGWRLPAPALEQLIANSIRTYLRVGPGKNLILDPDVQKVRSLYALSEGVDADLLTILNSARIDESTIRLALDGSALAKTCKTNSTKVHAQLLNFEIPFVQKRRGVEARFFIADSAAKVDPILLGNVARAHQWLARLKAGEAFDDIAASETTTRKRVQQTLEFAFLAPDIVRDIIAGKQPPGFTSTWCMTQPIPAEWRSQRGLIATL